MSIIARYVHLKHTNFEYINIIGSYDELKLLTIKGN